MVETDPREARAGIRSVARAGAILRLLADGRRRGAAELALELGAARGTVHGILRTLHAEGLVDQDRESAKYGPGPALLAAGCGYLRGSALRSASLNAARSLAAASGCSVRVGLLHRGRVLIVHQEAPPGVTDHAGVVVGALEPADRTALGRALTEPAPGDGWAYAIEEPSSGIAGIAAPIAAPRLVDPGAIGIQGPLERLCENSVPRTNLARAVSDAARTVARELGGDWW